MNPVTLRRALQDQRLLGNALPGPSWRTWRALLLASRGEPLEPAELELVRAVIGDRPPPSSPVREFAVAAGRRSGKDCAAATLAVYLSCLVDHSHVLRRGERGAVLCVGADQQQAKVTKGYCEGMLAESPVLSAMVANVTQDEIELTNGIVISVRAASFRRLRGLTLIGAICSELAFWIDSETSANPADEILSAIRPATLTTAAPITMISSPYSRSGPLFDTWRDYYGKDDAEVLVARAPTRVLNPTIPQDEIDRAMKRDPAAARSEYLAEWRDDVAAFIDRAAIEACVDSCVLERQPHAHAKYFGFVDPSGGSADSFAMAIAHADDGRVIVDCLREVRPPFNPESVVHEFCETLRRYRITQVTGDRYAGEWPREQFRKRGVTYECSNLDASALYRELLPRLNQHSIALLDDRRSLNQLCALERRVGRTGKDAISHPRGGHDDSGNAIAGVAWIAGDGAPKSGMRVGHYPPGGGLITWLDTNGQRPSALRGGAHQTARASGRYWKRWNPNRNCFE